LGVRRFVEACAGGSMERVISGAVLMIHRNDWRDNYSPIWGGGHKAEVDISTAKIIKRRLKKAEDSYFKKKEEVRVLGVG